MTTTDDLRRRIAEVEAELQALREQLIEAEAEAEEERAAQADAADDAPAWPWPLSADEYDRYTRQLILPGIGVEGQLRLREASVLIVGAGGLGCPAALYLAGAGVGHIAVVDDDVVEVSNLHRQIAHATGRVGVAKADSLATALRQLNPRVRCTAHRTALTPANARQLVEGHKLVLDCTDHPAVRYLVSDACVLAGVPVVSAAALRTDAQLVVLNAPPPASAGGGDGSGNDSDSRRGPCYRCVFPRPPPAASQTSCAEGGVLGPVVGVMGVLQALEAIRLLVAGTSDAPSSSLPSSSSSSSSPSLMLFSAGGAGGVLAPPSFRSVRLKGRRADCFACAPDAPLKKLRLLDGDGVGNGEAWPDYVQFCGGGAGVTAAAQTILAPEERVSAVAFRDVLAQSEVRRSDMASSSDRPFWLLDVREKEFFRMGSIREAVNVPFSVVQAAASQRRPVDEAAAAYDRLPAWLPSGMAHDAAPVYVICRMGNDSQMVARQLKNLGLDHDGQRFIGDIQGGMRAWKQDVDSTIPFA